MRPAELALLALSALACSCASGEEAAARPTDSVSSPPAAAVSAPLDSLVLTAPGGVTVWWSGVRSATDSAGTACTERGLVIARGDTRTLVPLLMTRSVPRLVNDSTIRARLSLNCGDVDTYDVNLRTGRPARVP
jgi:hypothetical protein